MKKICFLVSIITLSIQAGASEFLEFGAKDFKSKKLKDSKLIFDVGANYMAYPTTLPAFQGAHETIKAQDDYEVYGLGMAFGGELYFGAGFSSTIKVGGFYSKTLNEVTGQAAKDIDIDLAKSSSSHMVYGTEASGSLNYLFETKSVGIQPFVEFGVGTGIADIEKTYEYKGLASSSNPNPEFYNIDLEENFNFARTSVGVNFISATGIVSYVKLSRLGMVVNKREYKGSIQTANDSSRQSQNGKFDDLNESVELMMASLGLGFMF